MARRYFAIEPGQAVLRACGVDAERAEFRHGCETVALGRITSGLCNDQNYVAPLNIGEANGRQRHAGRGRNSHGMCHVLGCPVHLIRHHLYIKNATCAELVHPEHRPEHLHVNPGTEMPPIAAFQHQGGIHLRAVGRPHAS